MSLSPLKPVIDTVPDKEALMTDDILQKLALASLVHQNGGRMVFPLKDLDYIRDNTMGLNSQVISSQHTTERWFVLNTIVTPVGSAVVQ
jgi:hypothetical protein